MSGNLTKTISLAALGLGGSLLAYRALRPKYKIRDKVVLITGGSRGLGLVLAREFAERGARVAICARDRDELQRAKEDLESRGAEVFDAVCDVREQGVVGTMIADIRSRFGR